MSSNATDGTTGLVYLAHATPGDLPPPLTPERVLTGWVFEPLPWLFAVTVAAVYLYGVYRLRARGDQWSRWRTVSFVGLGLGSFIVATGSSLAAYDTVLLSVHMVQHMVLNMVVPIFLALGAPITLALRTLPRRPRGWLLSVLHSRLAKVLTFPVYAGVVFVINPFALYFTPLYEATLRNALLHDLNHIHFVLVGCLWFWPLLGLDPMPRQWAYPIRLLAVFATLPFHAWMGVAIMSAHRLIAEDWYLNLGREWGPSPLEDQRIAGGILWSWGDIVGVIIFMVLFAQWVRSSEREAQRIDRQLDRMEAAEAAARARAAQAHHIQDEKA
ncbi:cytochrome C oxidase assembly protein [Carbonactinospora thermoautotrophica]|uniref:Cytochrome C oxidase assembly protein n=1 Tax=Carbonactinospora thermoautotrophica TaxID=1469144 RepID=A0A132MV54_9ACTN|nr:cytochrome c oxidase assembly protein [Carbonactinospora thermoautotrophica]KWX00264.1 cytochrome C oxidase assembly protein [Carbonactinospora thermoautotrophica]KWX01684.1 Membrane protein-like protein [Carbonactinospora thermoautotrophica]KWX07688.1 cytochrome C oxidase assembly protein [Carbonactinospora thermoautotrophica]